MLASHPEFSSQFRSPLPPTTSPLLLGVALNIQSALPLRLDRRVAVRLVRQAAILPGLPADIATELTLETDTGREDMTFS